MEEAFRLNVKWSLQELSRSINGDGKSGPNPLFKVKVVLEGDKVRVNIFQMFQYTTYFDQFYIKIFLEDKGPFPGATDTPLWAFGDVCPGFQSQGGFLACTLSCLRFLLVIYWSFSLLYIQVEFAPTLKQLATIVSSIAGHLTEAVADIKRLPDILTRKRSDKSVSLTQTWQIISQCVSITTQPER